MESFVKIEQLLDKQINLINGGKELELDCNVFKSSKGNNRDLLETIIEVLIDGNKQDLLKHPVVEAYLLAKWDKIWIYALMNLGFYVFFLCVLTYEVQPSKTHLGWSITLAVCLFIIVYRELSEMYSYKKWVNYLQFENLTEWLVIISTSFYLGFLWGDDKPNDRLDGSEETAENAGAWAMLFGK